MHRQGGHCQCRPCKAALQEASAGSQVPGASGPFYPPGGGQPVAPPRPRMETRLPDDAFASTSDDRDRLAGVNAELVDLLRRCVARLDYADKTLREENEGPYDEEATFATDICDIHVALARYAQEAGPGTKHRDTPVVEPTPTITRLAAQTTERLAVLDRVRPILSAAIQAAQGQEAVIAVTFLGVRIQSAILNEK
jgi:hypothetical protein